MKWNYVEMDKVANVVSGYGFPREYQGLTDEEFPFFKVGDMNLFGNEKYMTTVDNTISEATLKKLKGKVFPQGTIIFPKIGAAIATNKKRLLTQSSVVDNNIMGLIPKSNINSLYLFYWMLQFDLRSVSNIGPVPSMRKSDVERISIPLPPISEQRRIVEILDQADALRKKRAEADEKAARILPALFYKMFGDPNENVSKDRFVKISEYAQIIMGQSPPGDTYNNNQDGLPFFQGKMDFGDINPIPRKWCSAPGRIAYKGDILLCVRAPVGPTNLANQKSCIGRGLAAIRPIAGKSISEFLLYSIKAQEKQIAQIGQGSTFSAIRRKDVENILIPRVNIDKQRIFSKFARDIMDCHLKLRISENNFESLFASLLYRAFTGDLTAKWREAHMKELLAEMKEQAKELEEIKP